MSVSPRSTFNKRGMAQRLVDKITRHQTNWFQEQIDSLVMAQRRAFRQNTSGFLYRNNSYWHSAAPSISAVPVRLLHPSIRERGAGVINEQERFMDYTLAPIRNCFANGLTLCEVMADMFLLFPECLVSEYRSYCVNEPRISEAKVLEFKSQNAAQLQLIKEKLLLNIVLN